MAGNDHGAWHLGIGGFDGHADFLRHLCNPGCRGQRIGRNRDGPTQTVGTFSDERPVFPSEGQPVAAVDEYEQSFGRCFWQEQIKPMAV